MMDFVFYYYAPAGAAGGIFTALFGICTLLHIYQLLRTRIWFMIPFTIGAVLECVGYVGRLLSSIQTPDFTKGPYVMQSALILIAPAFLAASIYMTLGRIIAMLDAERYSVIPLRLLTKIFVAGDVLSFLMQASGAGIMVKNTNSAQTGENIIVSGLFVQIVFFGFFVITAGIFELRAAKQRLSVPSGLRSIWRRHMMALCFTSVLILIRSVIRVVEYLMGYDSYLIRQEVFIYVFDAFLMFIVVLAFNWIHPSEVNCALGRGEKYSTRVVAVREYSTAAMEMEEGRRYSHK
ncbi:hypothetical protein BDV06DRAFT_234425 [Aspergillus oleicola]